MRHAQPEWVQEGVSVLDPVLTDQGRAQALHLAEAAKGWRAPAEVLVSPMRRTKETAEPVLETLGMTPRIQPWLEEMRLPGEWDGAPADQVSALIRASRQRSLEEWWDGLPGGESFRDFHHRVTTGLVDALGGHGARLREAHPELRLWEIEDRTKTLVFVGHGGSNAVAIGFLLGIQPVPWQWERFVMLHASITRLKATPLLGSSIFGLREHSDVKHLPRELRSR